MEAAGVMRERPSKDRKGRTISAYDSALIRYKVEKKQVGITLAVETFYTNESGYCEGWVEHVDTYAVKFVIDVPEMPLTTQWVGKAFLVSVGDTK